MDKDLLDTLKKTNISLLKMTVTMERLVLTLEKNNKGLTSDLAVDVVTGKRKPDKFDVANAQFDARAAVLISPAEKARVSARFATLRAMP